MYKYPWRMGECPTAAVRLVDGCGLDCCSGQSIPVEFENIAAQLTSLRDLSRIDSIALSGGEPTQHPELTKVVKLARTVRDKVVLCTNGYDVSAERLSELRDAGLWGVNLRINRNQLRPGWRGCNDVQIESLRGHHAEVVAGLGGLACSYELDLVDSDERHLADLMAWSARHVDRIQRLVLRRARSNEPHAEVSQLHELAEHWTPAGWLPDASNSTLAATVTWRIGRRGREILAASPRLLRMLCEYYAAIRRRSFAYLGVQSMRSQFICWLATIADKSLRPLAQQLVASLRHPTQLDSPHLASQFLFVFEQNITHPLATCAGAAYDSLSEVVS